MNQITHLIKTFTSAVIPAKAGTYTRWLFRMSADGGARLRTFVRMGPGLRRGDDRGRGDVRSAFA